MIQVKAIEHRQETLARHAKHVRDALGHKAFNQEMARKFGSHENDCAVL